MAWGVLPGAAIVPIISVGAHFRCWLRGSALIATLAVGSLCACNRRAEPRATALAPAASGEPHPVSIHTPPKLVSVETNRLDPLGRSVRVSCVSCHSIKGESKLPASAAQLKQFHTGLKVQHGAVDCASCHAEDDHTRLRLANGKTIPMVEVMTLCGQCHGPQMRDYRRGSHGGMMGYWDTKRGPRTRNNCVDCHDPHAPAFVSVRPVLPPRDRLLDWPAARTQGSNGDHDG